MFIGQKESFEILKENLQDKNKKKINTIIDDQKINLEQIIEKLKNNQIKNKDQIIRELFEKLFKLHKQKQKKATVFSLAGLSVVATASIVVSLMTTFIMPAVRQSKATITNGAIDSTYKYAWNENTGWINFAADNGNIQITDSELSGSALSETAGWINLDNVLNDGEGNLSGYGWGENIGWINFAPTNGGVVINSSGEFTGSALSETAGWIIFDGDYTAKTDWRPQSVRPACNNALDDDTDGLIDYPSDLGCESLTDDNEINPGRGISSSSNKPPQKPSTTKTNPKGEFKILINNNDEYTNNTEVELKLYGGSDTEQFAVSQDPDFKNAILQTYQPNSSGFQVLNFNIQDTKYQIQNTKYQIHVKFYTKYGKASKKVSDTIILDTTPVEPPIIIQPQNKSIIKTDSPTFHGTAEKESQISLELSSDLSILFQTAVVCNQLGNWSYTIDFQLADGNYQLKAFAKDKAGNISEVTTSSFGILTFVFPIEKPTEKELTKKELVVWLHFLKLLI